MRRLLPARLLAALRPEREERLELPSDVLHESRRRVRVAAAIGAAAYAIFLGAQLSGVLGGTPLGRKIDFVHDALGVSVCGTLLLVSATDRFRDRSILAAALGVEVLLSLLISIAVPWAGYLRAGQIQTLTWVVPIIVLFPLLVPAPPRTTLMVSILCALTMPAGLAFLSAGGRVPVRASDFIGISLAGAVAVGIASVASRTVYGAGRQIAAARRIGSYELIERLGQGGMGEVWKAHHLFLARPAAVKLILPEQLQGRTEDRETVIRRFTREAQVTAELCSPHTVDLFDFGIADDGALYYAMELLQGINVEHFVYQYGPLEPRRAAYWLQQACHSLGEAHARNLIHRDIKPSNLYVCRYGRDEDFVKVLDFGLTRSLEPQEAGLTQAGLRLGTPGYMAPEQIFGKETGPRTDLYSLGCVAYWLVTGARPFEADSAGELLRRHAIEPPPPPSRNAAHPLPERMEKLILSCLAKDSAERPPDVDHVCRELEQSFEGAPWSAGEAGLWWAGRESRG